MFSYYCGIDLHARFCQLCVIDDAGDRVAESKLPNDLSQILSFLQAYGTLSIAIESTFNWYWLVDGLQEVGHSVHLAHTLGLFMISGAKVKTDRRDAYKLARYLRMGELPQAHIYRQEKRPFRDLLRRRFHTVSARAAAYRGLRQQLMRYNQGALSMAQLRHLTIPDIQALPIPCEVVDTCAMIQQQIEVFSDQIDYIDDYLQTVTRPDPVYTYLLGIPGIWHTLALTIYYEVDTIDRFPSARHFASYCRLVPGTAQSAEKTKRGRGSKQGNHFLKWAFTQAANAAAKYYPECQRFRDKQQRKRAKTSAAKMIANCILAHKLATATFHVLKKEVPFEMNKLFA